MVDFGWLNTTKPVLCFLALVVASAVLFTMPATVLAEESSAEHRQLIVKQCDQLHDSISALRKRDLVSRLNRGRDYDDVVKQLNAFEQRLKNSHYDSSQFEQTSLKAANQVDQFREAYNRSDDGLVALAQIDCKTKPGDFETKLQEVRVLRQEVTATIKRVDETLQQYREAVVALQTQGQNGTEGQ
jgi:hypothetical protein